MLRLYARIVLLVRRLSDIYVWVVLQKPCVIRHMYNICLLTRVVFRAILRVDSAGSGAGGVVQPAIKAGWPGKPKNGQQPSRSPCATVWLPFIAALKDLKCEPDEASLWQKASFSLWA